MNDQIRHSNSARLASTDVKLLLVVPIVLSVLLSSCAKSATPTTTSIVKHISTTTIPTTTTSTTIAKSSTSTTPTIVEVEPSVGTATFTRSGSTPDYTVTVNYPVLGGMISRTIQSEINSQVISAVSNWTNSFVQNSSISGQSGQGSNSSSLSGSYKVILVDSKVASFQFLLSESGQGSTSQSSLVETLNFNLATGSLYNLDNLFQPSSNYLSVLSSASIQLLATQLASSNVSLAQLQNNSQLGPLPANFTAFNVAGNGLEIAFAQGQVDQTSLGIMTVVIPSSTLSSVINPNGPLANP